MKRETKDQALEIYSTFLNREKPDIFDAHDNSIAVINIEINELLIEIKEPLIKIKEFIEMKDYITNIHLK